MTLNEIAYNIKNVVEGGIHGTDSNTSIRQIKSMIHYHRAQLLLKYTDGGRYLSEKCYSEINNYIPSDGKIDAPEVVGFANNKGISSISIWPSGWDQEADDRIEIPIQDNNNKEFFVESRFTGNSIRAYIRDGIIRFYEGNELYTNEDAVYLIKAILAKPDTGDSEYPIPDELVASLIESVLSKEFNMMLTVGKDVTNNSVDDNIPGVSAASIGQSSQPSANARSRRARTR